MSSVNKVILVGNLGADPESRSFQNDGKDNPGLAGLITAKEYQFARQIADLATV